MVVHELQAEVLVEQGDAVAHVVEDYLHDLARMLGVAPCRCSLRPRLLGHVARILGSLFGGGQSFLPLLQIRDIHVDRDKPAFGQRTVPDLQHRAVGASSLERVDALPHPQS